MPVLAGDVDKQLDIFGLKLFCRQIILESLTSLELRVGRLRIGARSQNPGVRRPSVKATRVLITGALVTDCLEVMACLARQNAHKPSPDSWILAPLLELLQLSQYLLAVLFDLRIVFLGILHR